MLIRIEDFILMYAYIDETGNTGANLFDPNQPIFMTCALICRTNFDLLYSKKIGALAKLAGVDYLHANKLGVERISILAPMVYKLIRNVDLGFFIARVNKTDLATIKLFDTIFDAGENLAVPWQAYNYRPLRYLLVLKIASLLDKDLVRKFWQALMEPKEHRASGNLKGVLQALLSQASSLPDRRSREIVKQALQWAIENPEAIHSYRQTKADRYGHLPNMAVFPQLLRGIEKKSQKWSQNVVEIKHDRQTQFQRTLTEWHEIVSKADKKVLEWTLDEKYVIRAVSGSKFTVCSSEESAGLQVVDLVLWLTARYFDCQFLPPECRNLLNCIFQRSGYYEHSLESLRVYLWDFLEKLESQPISELQMEKAKESLEASENRRLENMEKYAIKKLGGA